MSRTAALLGGVAAAVAVLALVPAGAVPVLIALVGAVVLASGHRRDRWAHVTVGGVVLVAAIVVAGLLGAADGLVLLATVGAVLAWDAVENALGLRAQLGPDADTRRAELIHLGATASVTAGLAGLVYFASLLGRGRIPAVTGIALVGGAILIALGLAPVGREAA